MVNWDSEAEIVKDYEIFTKLVQFLFGLYVWEIANTFSFDWSVITGKRPFRWPLVAWFMCRYSCLAMLIAQTYVLNADREIRCLDIMKFTQWANNMAIGTASLLLMFRTFAVWNLNIKVIIPVSIISIAHWALLSYDTKAFESAWEPEYGRCIARPRSSPSLLAAPYIYTITFDLLILCLTTAGLIIRSPDSRGSQLWHLLFTDGLVFFIIVTLANVLPMCFILLELNTVMNLISAVPAAIANAIIATRLVVRLNEYTSRDTVYVSSAAHKSVPNGAQYVGNRNARRKSHGVQITMETFTETHVHSASRGTAITTRQSDITFSNVPHPNRGLTRNSHSQIDIDLNDKDEKSSRLDDDGDSSSGTVLEKERERRRESSL